MFEPNYQKIRMGICNLCSAYATCENRVSLIVKICTDKNSDEWHDEILHVCSKNVACNYRGTEEFSILTKLDPIE